jgi:hypothetical protein
MKHKTHEKKVFQIDGKDTFHSMARAVFQTCRSRDDSCLRQLKVRRGQERTFQLTKSASTSIPSAHSAIFLKAFEIREGLPQDLGLVKGKQDMIVDALIVDAKPNDIATVYTTMQRCAEMINGLGQRYFIQNLTNSFMLLLSK